MSNSLRESLSAKRRIFDKQYLPGYTGFVPTKNDFFAMTAGKINQAVV